MFSKCVKEYIFFLVLILQNLDSSSQIITTDNSGFYYQISSVYKFKRGVVSLTFDDGSINQFKIALPLLKKLNLPATFYLITGNIDTSHINTFQNEDRKMHEIGSHTVNHKDLKELDSKSVQLEINESREGLINSFGDNSGLTLAYPWGSYNNTVKELVKKNYLAARSANTGYNSIVYYDTYSLNVQTFNESTSYITANGWLDFAAENALWLVEMHHDSFDKNFSRHLEYVNMNQDKIWCGTVSDVIKYSEEYRNAKVSCDSCDDFIFTFRIDDSLDDNIFNHPLSLKIRVPDNWEDITLSDYIEYRIEHTDKNTFVLFEAKPDNKQIIIKPQRVRPYIKESGIKIISFTSNPFIDYFNLTIEIPDNLTALIELYDLCGTILYQQKVEDKGIVTYNISGNHLRNGIYVLRLKSSSGENIFKKIIKAS